jgi:SAM-dependent methyltransferase
MAAGERTVGTAGVNGPLWGSAARDWASIQEGQFRPGYEAALARCGVGAGTDYLDAGCGAGMAAQMAAGRGARVCGFDAAEPLLEIARERVPEGDFRAGDLESVPFGDAAFDVVSGFNAFQFAGDPVRALAEARRVARPGGTVVVMTWGDPEGMEAAAIVGALRGLLPAPPPGAPGPFALGTSSMSRVPGPIPTWRQRCAASARRALRQGRGAWPGPRRSMPPMPPRWRRSGRRTARTGSAPAAASCLPVPDRPPLGLSALRA